MKNVLIAILATLVLVGAVAATDTTLDDDYLEMQYNSIATVTYCIFEQGNPVDIAVTVDPICKELDGVFGCSAGDTYNPAGFSVVPNDATTGADGCVDLTITTQNEDGLFVYTVNGDNGQTYVGAETGSVFVPEFGIVAALAVLGLAGLFIYRKRQ